MTPHTTVQAWLDRCRDAWRTYDPQPDRLTEPGPGPDPADVVTPVDGVYDVPSRIAEQAAWLRAAGLEPRVAWAHRDLAVLVARP